MSAALTGQCLCGDITYRLNGELLYLYHCHCVECRRFSGASFATNATIESEKLALSDPKGHLKQLPLSKGFRNFCGRCGSPLFSCASLDTEFYSLHCGSLDNPPDINVQANLWVSEKCPWTDIKPGAEEYQAAPDSNSGT